MSLLLALTAAAMLAQAPADGPIASSGATRPVETAEDTRRREAIAYFYELPKSAPTGDYELVAWCAGRVSGHVDLGASLPDADAELMRLAQLELADFQDALRAGALNQSAETIAAADAARAEAYNWWRDAFESPDPAMRAFAFDTFFGIPGRCEHAARRVRDNITTPPATLAEVGLHAAE